MEVFKLNVEERIKHLDFNNDKELIEFIKEMKELNLLYEVEDKFYLRNEFRII